MTRALPLPILALLLSGCATPTAPTTPQAPTAPQIKLAQDVTVLRNALPVALTALQAARSAGSIPADAVTVAESKVLVPLAQLGKTIDAELVSGHDWPTQKAAVLTVIAKAGISAAAANLPAQAQVILAAVLGSYNTIAASVGGPQLP